MSEQTSEALRSWFRRVEPLIPELFNIAHVICGNYDQAELALRGAILEVWADSADGGMGFREKLRGAVKQEALDQLKAAQDADQPMPCPRCGAYAMKHPMTTNALSRHADLYICDSCGMAEALLAFMGQTYPMHQWSAFEPHRPPADFRAKPTSAVLAEVIQKLQAALIRESERQIAARTEVTDHD
jgi:predicted RNA-binding Zn-ribbon protein involved in translation (DUF1610 family)